MIWNVFYHNINRDTIGVFNIFDHPGFKKDVDEAFKKCKTKEDFTDRIGKDLYYHFGSKSEWETFVTPWCGSRSNDGMKVDPRIQVRMNWDIFIDYLWNQRG